MSRQIRLVVFALSAAAFFVFFVAAARGLPGFGTSHHPYGARAIHAAVAARATANTVSSVNFDQRAFDTLGEEFILFASVIGAVVLLRAEPEEAADSGESPRWRAPRVLAATRLFGYLMLPVTLLVGSYVVLHGQLSPGGGFQGGVVLGSAVHLLYLTGDYAALRAARPMDGYEIAESLGAGTFVLVGLVGLLGGAAFATNMLPYGTLRGLGSGGIVPLLNVAVGVAVGCGMVVLLAQFFRQDLELRVRGARGSAR